MDKMVSFVKLIFFHLFFKDFLIDVICLTSASVCDSLGAIRSIFFC